MLEIKQLTRLQIIKYCEKLEEENKRVKERADDKQAELRKEIKHLNEMIYKFEEENRKLKEELSKFRDSFKKYRDYEKEELAESCYDLAMENKKLKEKIEKLEKELSAVYKAYHTAMGVDYIDADLYDLDC